MLVSVIVAAYNAEKYIREALASVFRQTHPDVEAIVCDDHSTDNTANIVREVAVADPRIKLLVNEKNKGPAFCRNRALEAAQGNWIAVLDADDFFRHDRIATLLGLATRHKADLVFDNLMYISSGGECLGAGLDVGGSRSTFPCSAESFIRKDCSCTVSYGYLKPFVRKGFLDENNIKQRVSFKTGEDFVFSVECLIAGANAFITTEPMYFYRQTASSISRSISVESWDTFLSASEFLKGVALQAGKRKCITELVKRERHLRGSKVYYTTTIKIKNENYVQAIKCCFNDITSLDIVFLILYKRVLDILSKKSNPLM